MQPTLDRDTIASPPDDGGHRGTFTRPADVAMVPEGPGMHGPPTHEDPVRTNTIHRDEHPHRGLGWPGGTLLIALICAAAVALVTLIAGG